MVSHRPDSPAMQQYLSAKSQQPDALLFFRMGDFYELFFEDAIEAAQLLELTLTSRNKNDDNPVPMAGVPHHAAASYVQRLVAMGKKVAICDQVESAAQAKGLVRREITHVVTPGVQLDADALDARTPNYLAAIEEGIDGLGLAYADVTTGHLHVTTAPNTSALLSELLRVEPREIITDEAFRRRHAGCLDAVESATTTTVGRELFDPLRARDALAERGPAALQGSALAAAGALFAYVEQIHPAVHRTLGAPEPYTVEHAMGLGPTALANLEILRTLIGGRRQGSLLGLLDRTRTGMGGRTLRRWLQYPLVDPRLIERRLDVVQALCDDTITRSEVVEALAGVYDLERLCGRARAGLATPRDLTALRSSLGRLPELRAKLRASGARALRELAERVALHEALCADLEATLVDSPPPTLKDGGVIRPEADDDLAELVSLATDGKSWVMRYEAKQRAETQIESLKVGYNRVFGYYIEVTKANLSRVPPGYYRKQTLANAERYFTDELKTYEEKIVTADERRIALEHSLFDALRARVAEAAHDLVPTARAVAEIDAFAALALVAHERRYCRPRVDRSRRLRLVAARHPVIEASLKDQAFVPNDIELDSDGARLILVTGPNMAGKSTAMRQVALITLMAQIGSFVPGEQAEIGVVDHIFTRVGAADDLSRGQSTFMVEMTETAEILEHATKRSLVILDEIGRGTSTFDGVSIAWAVAEHLHDRIGARTLFATHYHELTALAQSREGIRNQHVAVKEFDDRILFLRKLVDGGTNRSYGIQVGRLAGLPREVVLRAKEVLAGLESGQIVVHAPSAGAPATPSSQLALFGAGPAAPSPAPAASGGVGQELIDALRPLALDTLSPLEALNTLYSLKAIASKAPSGEKVRSA